MYKFKTGNQVKHVKSGKLITLSGQVKGKWRLFEGKTFLGLIASEKLSVMISQGQYEIMESVKIHFEKVGFSVLGA